jgi:polysaccharide pyruvyl transferase WcaK-like protein
MDRRQFIKQSGILTAGALLFPQIKNATEKDNPILLVVSGWQDVNIGDIAHTPGLLHILETFVPQATIILWKRSKGEAVASLLNTNFPKIKIIYGDVDNDMKVNSKDVLNAFEESDIMVHGSGPSVVGEVNLASWQQHTGKPFGIFGVTIQNIGPDLKVLLEKASFIYTRETKSLEVLRDQQISGSHVSFAPDATFFLNIHDPSTADQFLKENDLEEKKFICAIPRLRVTPRPLTCKCFSFNLWK